MRDHHLLRALAFSTSLLTGCSLFPSRTADLVVLHDFGPGPIYHLHTHPVLITVQSVAWLAGTDIHYRLLYRNPTAVHVYADNRWVAPPTALIMAALHAQLGPRPLLAGQTPRNIFRLTVHILNFDQDFSSPTRAFVHIQVLAQLININTGQIVATKLINRTAACQPDIQGAVTRLSQLAKTLTTTLSHWTIVHTHKDPR